ncbi:MAG TPA: hypothetical protein VMT24_14745 [Aggregatilineaceae bacterium]|nr:hypothetical protein [Aggregatilineaceae bacterium]
MKQFAVLQLSGCAGCEVSLLNASEWLDQYRLMYMPLVSSAYDVPEVDILLVTGGLRTEEDLYSLRRAAPRAKQIVAVGTCAISGGVANLGDRPEVREVFLSQAERHDLPHLLPTCRPIDVGVQVDRYLPGCPPTPELFMAALGVLPDFEPSMTVCQECGRRKPKDMRPTHLTGPQTGDVLPEICLINQGFLCIGTSTRGGCRALCTRPGYPCVGCRGPSDAFIEKESEAWLTAIQRVFAHMTAIPDEEINQALRSPQLSMFLFQFSDVSSTGRPPRQKETML